MVQVEHDISADELGLQKVDISKFSPHLNGQDFVWREYYYIKSKMIFMHGE